MSETTEHHVDPRQPSAAVIGVLVTGIALFVYWLGNHNFDAGRGDFFYLADAFLKGHTWIDVVLGPNDVIYRNGHIYVPFAPFPAIALMPLVAITGPETADRIEPVVNAFLAACTVGLSWWVSGRIGVRRLGDRLMLALLLGFSTQIWWVTTRGGVWHTGQLIATILSLLALGELFGRQRSNILGLLLGFAFLTRAPIAFAAPVLAFWFLEPGWASDTPPRTAVQRLRNLPWDDWFRLGLGFLPSLVFFLWYNVDRFGSPMESGYALATLPAWLEALRQQGLFSLRHVGMNLNYLFVKLPAFSTEFPFYRPDGLGMSVFFTSPGLLLAARAPWRDRRAVLLALAAFTVLVPTLLYYGGGWLQYGYRYFLDSIPYVWALVAMGVARASRTSVWSWTLTLWGVLIGAGGVYWAYHL